MLPGDIASVNTRGYYGAIVISGVPGLSEARQGSFSLFNRDTVLVIAVTTSFSDAFVIERKTARFGWIRMCELDGVRA